MEKEFDNLIQGAEKAEALSNRVKDWMASNISEEEFPSEAKKVESDRTGAAKRPACRRSTSVHFLVRGQPGWKVLSRP